LAPPVKRESGYHWIDDWFNYFNCTLLKRSQR
jgi:hypothetical protein